MESFRDCIKIGVKIVNEEESKREQVNMIESIETASRYIKILEEPPKVIAVAGPRPFYKRPAAHAKLRCNQECRNF